MNKDVHTQSPAGTVREIEGDLAVIWSQVLGLDPGKPGVDDNFFALGGDSLLIVRVMDRVNALYFGDHPDAALPITHFFSHGTIRALAASLRSCLATRDHGQNQDQDTVAPAPARVDGIAIIGMACRLPGASGTDAFWSNLRDGIESIQCFSDEQLLDAGLSSAEIRHPGYVKAGVLLHDVQHFDAGYFGLTPREAALTSPEQRLLIECSEEALQHGGHGAREPGQRVGVYVGAGLSSYLLDYLASNVVRLESAEGMAALASNTSAATRISYVLDLTGPSMTIDTACSSSLVAVHQACQAILSGECTMALAAGATVRAFGPRGYRAEEGGIFSPDGHCRPFDRLAQGTVGSSGVGVVLLKHRSQAIADGDTIHAVILGTAVNNDGGTKVGYTAPSASGQASVIRSALAAAHVDASSIQYVETHGTATALGDRIELAALSEVFPEPGPDGARCTLGTLKANIGHVEAAAGIAGLIKATLALKHRQIPPAIQFTEPGDAIAESGFCVNPQLTDWPARTAPRRAGVSAFGIGGTNAHAILEEGERATPGRSHRSTQLLIVSARSEAALRHMCRTLADHLEADSQVTLADVAGTLQIGRKAHGHRHFVAASSVPEAVQGLRETIATVAIQTATVPVVYMFPGQGSQHQRMAQGVYETEPVFREHIDRCAHILRPTLGRDLRDILHEDTDEALNETQWCQPALFTVEYSFARLWQSWGVRPSVMIGHSLGEYVAACISGVLGLEDALELVAVRGRLMQSTPPGKMLAVKLDRSETKPLLSGSCALAAVNGSRNCVVSGTPADVDRLRALLSAQNVPSIELKARRAFHSSLMDDILRDFERVLRRVAWGDVRIPFVSNLTGRLIEPRAAASPAYWIAHLRETVDFAGGVQTLLAGQASKVFLEMGPDTVLGSCVRSVAGASSHCIVRSGRRAEEAVSDSSVLMSAVGRAWQSGVPIDWPGFNARNKLRRVALPTYPFERQRHWIESARSGSAKEIRTSPGRPVLSDWFYVPVWRRKPRLAAPSEPARELRANCCLIVDAPAELEDPLATGFSQKGIHAVCVRTADRFSYENGRYSVNPSESSACAQLFSDLSSRDLTPGWIVHAGEAHEAGTVAEALVGSHLTRGVLNVLDLCRVLLGQCRRSLTLTLVTSGAHNVTGNETANPSKAMLAAVRGVIAAEASHLICRSIDVASSGTPARERSLSIEALVQEILGPSEDDLVAYRGADRWVRDYEKLVPRERSDDSIPLREKGVYLVTGGLGGVGWTLAESLARTTRARLILVGRSRFPDRTEWPAALDAGEAPGERNARIREIRALESLGAEIVIVQGDVADRDDMKRIADLAQSRFGGLHGVIHAAGVAGGGAIFRRTREAAEQVMAPKVMGTRVLHEACRRFGLDFFVCCSSLASVLAPPGQYDYCAANAFQDAFCGAHDRRIGTRFISINWDAWSSVGMAVNTAVPARLKEQRARALANGISCEEGARVFDRVLANPLPQWIVSTHGVNPGSASMEAPREPAALSGTTPIEAAVSRIWQDLLGVEVKKADDDFFELGGDSLLAAQLRSRLESHFSRTLSLRGLLTDPTLRGMTKLLQEKA